MSILLYRQLLKEMRNGRFLLVEFRLKPLQPKVVFAPLTGLLLPYQSEACHVGAGPRDGLFSKCAERKETQKKDRHYRLMSCRVIQTNKQTTTTSNLSNKQEVTFCLVIRFYNQTSLLCKTESGHKVGSLIIHFISFPFSFPFHTVLRLSHFFLPIFFIYFIFPFIDFYPRLARF